MTNKSNTAVIYYLYRLYLWKMRVKSIGKASIEIR